VEEMERPERARVKIGGSGSGGRAGEALKRFGTGGVLAR
jgi:hypothetical protein